jgi:type I restriction enzyme, S subunit
MTEQPNLIPKRRFREFQNTASWEQREFQNVFSHIQNNALSRADLNYENGYALNLHYGDILIRFGEYLDVSNNKLPMISNELVIAKYKASFLKDGDIVIADAAEDQTVGKCCEIAGLEDVDMLAGLHTIPCRPNWNFASGYLGYYMNSFSYHDQLLPLIQGTKVSSISKSALKNTNIKYPKENNEQIKIGTLFKQLDNLITLHQRKLEKTKALKSAYLSEMFPAEGEFAPKRRFAGFTQAWEQLKLDDIFNVLDGDRGKNYPGESDFYENGATLFLDTGNVKKNGFDFFTKKYITKEKDESLRSGKLELHDFVLTSRGTLGNVAYYDEKTRNNHPSVRINSAMLILRPVMRKQVSDDYMATVLRGNIIDTFMTTNHVGSAQPHITKRDFSKVSVGIPSTLEEQITIGTFFKQLDKNIALYQRKLQKLKNIKKAYLNEMFV